MKTAFIKDYKHTKLLEKAGKEAGINALRHSRALGLTICYIQDGVMYEEHSNGAIFEIKQLKQRKSPIVLRKGMILLQKR